MKSFKSKVLLTAFASLTLTACGSDSTGPSNLDAASALKSLSIGLQLFGAPGTAGTLETDDSFGGIAPFLNQVTVDINGSSQPMFALALRESFPDGTCWETIFQNVIPGDPTSCTPPPLGLMVLLWQSHSPSAPPDRMAILAGDVGTSDFSFDTESLSLPAVALYAEGQDSLWVSESGTLTSVVSSTPVSCNIPLPAYAKSGQCSIATFDEQGSVVLGAFDAADVGDPSGPTKTLTIPHQTLHGLWLAITEVQPIGLTATPVAPGAWIRRLAGR